MLLGDTLLATAQQRLRLQGAQLFDLLAGGRLPRGSVPYASTGLRRTVLRRFCFLLWGHTPLM
jgi:hypothetical protein